MKAECEIRVQKLFVLSALLLPFGQWAPANLVFKKL